MTVRAWLVLFGIFLILSLAGLGGATFYVFYTAEKIDYSNQHASDKIEDILTIRNKFGQIPYTYHYALSMNMDGNAKLAIPRIVIAEKNLDELLLGKLLEDYPAAQEQLKAIAPGFRKGFEFIKNEASYDAFELFKKSLSEPIEIFEKHLAGLADAEDVNAQAVMAKGTQELLLLRNIIIGIVVVLPLLVIGFLALIIHKIMTPLKAIGCAAQQMATGDYSARISRTGTDEFGSLAQAFNMMSSSIESNERRNKAELEELQQMLRKILVGIFDQDKEISMLSDMSAQLSDNSMRQATILEQVSEAARRIDQQTSKNANKASEANSLAKKVRSISQNGSREMTEMMQAMDNVIRSTENISGVIKTIDDIAFKTNLLALNAAVEAARAGSHGKGFSVVANEVRQLAGSSAKAASRTSTMLEESVKHVDHTEETVKKMDSELGEIAEGIVGIEKLFSDIAKASAEHSREITGISASMEEIESMTHDNSSRSEELSEAAYNLEQQSSSLSALLGEFCHSRNLDVGLDLDIDLQKASDSDDVLGETDRKMLG